MIYEDDVVDSVIDYLKREGYDLISYCHTRQRGYDIVAKKHDKYMYVEAKGEGSSDPRSNRYGKKFDSSQMRDHVSAAIYKALEIKNQNPSDNVAIAFPDNKRHLSLLSNVLPSLKQLNIKVFIVNSNRNVTILQQ